MDGALGANVAPAREAIVRDFLLAVLLAVVGDSLCRSGWQVAHRVRGLLRLLPLGREGGVAGGRLRRSYTFRW